MLNPTEAIATAPAISSAGNLLHAGKFFCAGRTFTTFRAGTPPDSSGISRSVLPDSGNHPAMVPTGSPLAIPERMATRLPRKGGHPKTREGCHSSLGSSGDISISHSGVSRGHRNVPHALISHYTTSPDSTGLPAGLSYTTINPSNKTHSSLGKASLCRSCAPSDRTRYLYGSSVHNNMSEPEHESTHRTLPTQINPTIT